MSEGLPPTINAFLEALYKSNKNRVEGDSSICELFGEESPFRLVCAKCGSTDITVIGEAGVMYSEYTGYVEGSTVVKCISCGAALSVEA